MSITSGSLRVNQGCHKDNMNECLGEVFHEKYFSLALNTGGTTFPQLILFSSYIAQSSFHVFEEKSFCNSEAFPEKVRHGYQVSLHL